MKKKLLKAFVISLIINILLFSINMFSANIFHKLPISLSIPGGECVEYIGFGAYLLIIFPMVSYGDASVSYHIGFNLISFIIPVIVMFLLIFVFEIIISKRRKLK